MATPKQVLKSVGPKLVPFFKAVAIYFVLFIPSDQPSLFAMVIKCLPVVSLIAFVLLHGMSLGEEYTYSRRVLLGLVFSLVGDALLVWEEMFVHGLTSFLVAQILYISAFGFTPFNIYVAAVTYTLMGVGVGVLMPGTEGVVSVGMPVYTFCLMTMVWRAVARVQFFEELWTWTKLCSCVGGVLFAVSDGLIGINAFCCTVPHGQALIMITYYAAQLGISLSVVDSKASYLDSMKDSVTSDGTRSSITTTPTTTTSSSISRSVTSAHHSIRASSVGSAGAPHSIISVAKGVGSCNIGGFSSIAATTITAFHCDAATTTATATTTTADTTTTTATTADTTTTAATFKPVYVNVMTTTATTTTAATTTATSSSSSSSSSSCLKRRRGARGVGGGDGSGLLSSVSSSSSSTSSSSPPLCSSSLS